MEQVEEYARGDNDYLTEDDLGLSAKEVQQLEMENNDLYAELTATSAEVQSIEGTVVEISRLQEIFTEKVLSQSDQIFQIHRTAVETTANKLLLHKTFCSFIKQITPSENTRSGNEELREAIKSAAGFRVWLLFIFIMASCCLLFLDWYH
eukprot:sb/3473585/